MKMEKGIKRILAVSAVILMFILCGCSSKSAGMSDSTADYAEHTVAVSEVEGVEFAVDSDYNIYFGGETLTKISPEGDKTVISGDIGFISSICYHDGYIYGYAPLESSVISVSAESGEKQTVCSISCNNVLGLSVCGKQIYMIAEPYSEHKPHTDPALFRIDIKSGDYEQLPQDDVSCLYVSESGRAFVYIPDGEESAVYEITDDGVEPVFRTGDIGEMFSFVYENGTLYYSSVSGDIMKLCKGGEPTVYVYEANAIANGSMRFVNGNLIYINTGRRAVRSKYILGKDSYSPVTINDKYSSKGGASNSILKIGRLPELSGIPCKVKGFDRTETILKIMAGDSDVDIYFLDVTEVRELIEKGLYTPIRSEIISRHNDSCFDYLSDFCRTEEGEIVLMPLSSSVNGVLMPKSALSEMSVSEDGIALIYDYLDLVRGYNGERKAYTMGDNLYSFLNYQYEKYHCDFKNGTFDYETEDYRRLYKELLSDSERYGEHPVKGFLQSSGADTSDTDGILTIDGIFGTFAESADDWRAFPVPKISDKVEANFVNAVFAYINPYSENKEAAIKVLEAIAENYDALAEGSAYEAFRYPFIKKDKADYGQRYHTDSDLFSDFYEIAADGFVHEYQIMSAREDIDRYQSGKLSLDEAIAMYQREVDFWLNE